MSRIATGQATLDLQEIDIGTLIASVVESLVPKAASDQIDLRVQGMPTGLVLGDRRRLEQVFFNLLGNALKFTPSGGHITIDAACIDDWVEFRVRDSGVGIEPEFLPHVFERFRQGDSTRTRSYSGLGLGLSIAKQYVEAHGGSITVDSAGRNLGTTFSVRLPVATRRPERAIAGAQTERVAQDTSAPRLDGIHVLVVDDEPDARDVMAHALLTYGAHVTRAASATQAFEVLSGTHIDVVLADIAMPDEDGYSFMRRVRASSDTRIAAVPAAAVTAHARYADREQAFAAGFQCHLAKPVEPVQLARTVDRLARPGAEAA
jgi:CheY-like chemotaxis protein/two-component sensor histidine kinase